MIYHVKKDKIKARIKIKYFKYNRLKLRFRLI